MNAALTDDELRELLAKPHVGVLVVSAPVVSQPPLATPVWYAVDDGGDIVVVTGRTSRKVRLLAAAGRAAFVVHEDHAPRHATADADVAIEAPDDDVRRRIATRYVPPDLVEGYLAATADADTVVVRLRPRRWRSVDLTKAAAGA